MFQYRFFHSANSVIALSTFAGKPVRGVAKCDPADTFSIKFGKELASARCNEKIAIKRVKSAKKKYADAVAAFNTAKEYLDFMSSYLDTAEAKAATAKAEVTKILATLD